MITRFAPSPTGFLHLGNIRTALFNWLAAKQGGGVMQLRIEDTDVARSRQEYLDAILEDLEWLGLDFSGEAPWRPWRQSERYALYEQYIEQLGEHCYPCFCTPEELAAERAAQQAKGKPPRYSGKCARLASAEAQRRLGQGEAAVWRFRVAAKRQLAVSDTVRGQTVYASDDIADFVIRRANGDFSFLFVNALDDALLGVSDVLRGEDHVTNTPRQLLLLEALQLAAPRYGHIALIVGAGGKPLSKRDGLTAVRDWRQRGYLPAALLNYLARVGHSYRDEHAEKFMTASQLAEHFSCRQLGRAPAQYDQGQLHRWQKSAVMGLSQQDYEQWLGAARQQALRRLDAPAAFYALTRENVLLPRDSDDWYAVFAQEQLPPQAMTAAAAAAIGGALATADDFYRLAADLAEEEEWSEFCRQLGAASGKKGKALFFPLRAALTGRLDGPAMPLIYKQLSAQWRRARFLQAADAAAAAKPQSGRQ